MLPISVVLTPGYSDWEIAPLTAVGKAFYGAEITFMSPTGGPLTSAAGLPIADTRPFTAPRSGVLVICGGPAFEKDDTPVLDGLAEAHRNGVTLAAICGGTLALARAGLLDKVAHTSNDPGYLTANAPAYGGQAHYREVAHAVADNGIITAPAPAPASFAAEVLKAAGLGKDEADGIAQMLAMEHGGAQA